MIQKAIAFIQELISGRVIKGYVRTLIAALGGYLLAKGVSAETVAQFIEALTKLSEALIPVIVAAIWSTVDKYKSVSQKELDLAVTGLTIKEIKQDSKVV